MTRAIALAGLLLLVLVLGGCGGGSKQGSASAAAAAADGKPKPTPTPAQLPGGGRIIFHAPKKRIVGFYGNPQDEELGALGIGSPGAMAKRLKATAAKYETKKRPVLPTMELLASVATYSPGDDGLYRQRAPNKTIRRYLKAARKINAILLLDIQPGRGDFFKEAKSLKRWLVKPDVSLALDPEWHVGENEVPGQVIGSVDASQVLKVGDWLDGIAERKDLPQKLFLIHQFTEGMIVNRQKLHPYKHLAVVLNVDGFGSREVKTAKYKEFAKLVPFAFNGFKLFYKEDAGLMTPKQVLHLKPSPDVIVYE